MENKKIISPLSFTSLILIIIVTYSSLTLTLFSNPTFSLFNYNITTRFTKSIQPPLFFFPSLLFSSSSSSPLFDPGRFSSPLLFKFFSPVRDKPFQNCCSA